MKFLVKLRNPRGERGIEGDVTRRDLTCRELVEFVMDYLDDALPAAERDAAAPELPEDLVRAVLAARGSRD